MLAAWYDRQGPAADVLQVGELPDPQPGDGEVRVRLSLSGISPGDVKKRDVSFGSPMAGPRVIPHSDGVGVIDAVGPGVDAGRVGSRVWVWGAQSYRPFGTAAQLTVVPDGYAVDLPPPVADEVGAALGIPGITAHRAVFGDGPVTGMTVLVQGALGAVGSLAAQLAHWGGAVVLGTVPRGADLETLRATGIAHAVALDDDPAAAVRAVAPEGVDRVVEVALSANVDLDQQVLAMGGVLACYASPDGRPTIPFWPLLFNNVTLRLLGSDDFPPAAKSEATRDLTAAAAAGALSVTVAAAYPLERIAEAHERVETGHPAGRVLVEIPA